MAWLRSHNTVPASSSSPVEAAAEADECTPTDGVAPEHKQKALNGPRALRKRRDNSSAI